MRYSVSFWHNTENISRDIVYIHANCAEGTSLSSPTPRWPPSHHLCLCPRLVAAVASPLHWEELHGGGTPPDSLPLTNKNQVMHSLKKIAKSILLNSIQINSIVKGNFLWKILEILQSNGRRLKLIVLIPGVWEKYCLSEIWLGINYDIKKTYNLTPKLTYAAS
jgi:hypothetical protein